MATIVTNLGSNTSIDTETPTTCSGSSSPYTVQFGTDPTGVSIGDIAVINDSTMASEFTFLITNISGSSYTLTYMADDSDIGDTSPCDMYNEMFGQASATFKRAYSTITAWEADLDNDNIYSSGDTAKGECYKDSAFSITGDRLRIDGGASLSGGNLAQTILTVPESQRHDGTADTGAKVNLSTGGRIQTWYQSASIDRTIEWLELDGGDSEQDFGSNWRIVDLATGSTTGHVGTAAHLLIHGCHNNQVNNGNSYGVIGGQSQYSYMHNNIIYDCSGRLRTPGILGSSNMVICNNTVYKIGMTYTSSANAGSREAIGIETGNSSCVNKNNIALGTYIADDGHDHEKYDYLTTGTGTVGTYNISGDSTASGSNSFTGKTADSLFVCTTSGSEDLHLRRDSAAVGAGTDLGTSITVGSDSSAGGSAYGTAINVDAQGNNREARSQAWDIGAVLHAVISSIGSNSRDYTTIEAWDADLDTSTYYGSGAMARGELYADSDFELSSGQTIDGGGTIGLHGRVLTAATGERHDGTANTGVRILCTSTSSANRVLKMDSSVGVAATPVGRGNQLEWIEVDCNEKKIRAGIEIMGYSGVQHCIVHSARWTGGYERTTGILKDNKLRYSLFPLTNEAATAGFPCMATAPVALPTVLLSVRFIPPPVVPLLYLTPLVSSSL